MPAVHSMTGSGSATGACELGRVTLEMRSVNGRGLQIRFRLAPECIGLERAIESAIRARITRGSMIVAADVVESAHSASDAIDAAAFAAARARLTELACEQGITNDVTVSDVLAVPGVLMSATTDRTRVSWDPSPELAGLIDGALAALIDHRATEGGTIAAAMLEHASVLDEELVAIRARLPEIVRAHREAILTRVNEFLDEHGTQLESADIVREVAQFADRIDVSEELQRLDAHLVRLRAALDGGSGPVGRDLEFLMQEILREVNTLGSKSPDVEVAHRVIAMKSAIDKLKEQAANLE